MPNLTANFKYQGARGYSAYEVAVQEGYEGTKEEFAEDMLKGIKEITKVGTGTPGTYDTYTIHYVNGDTYSFRVFNGANGEGAGDMLRAVYDPDNTGVVLASVTAQNVNGFTVEKNVPENAKFTDTTYSVATTTSNGLMSSTDKTTLIGYGDRFESVERDIATAINALDDMKLKVVNNATYQYMYNNNQLDANTIYFVLE